MITAERDFSEMIAFFAYNLWFSRHHVDITWMGNMLILFQFSLMTCKLIIITARLQSLDLLFASFLTSGVICPISLGQ